MLKIQKNKNFDGIEFDTIDISDCIKASEKIRDMNDYKFNTSDADFFGQCQQCLKGIKDHKKGFTIICNGNTETIVRRSHYNISEKSGGNMDCFDLGSECGKRVKKALREIGEDWKEWLGYYKEIQAS